jgi:hypothetical protein
MFLRKVHREFPDSIIKDIMQKDFNHKYELLHNQATQKYKFSYLYTFKKSIAKNILNALVIGCILLVGVFYSTCSFTKIFMN